MVAIPQRNEFWQIKLGDQQLGQLHLHYDYEFDSFTPSQFPINIIRHSASLG
jgi:hypothetical protein